MTELEVEAPFPKTEAHSSLKEVWLQVVRWWRRSVGCLGLNSSSNVKEVENRLPGTSELWVVYRQAHRNCQGTTVGVRSARRVL